MQRMYYVTETTLARQATTVSTLSDLSESYSVGSPTLASGSGKLQVQIGERLWNTTSTAIGERHYYYKYGIGERQFYLLGITTAENSASFYIAHIVHYSPIYLPAARTDER